MFHIVIRSIFFMEFNFDDNFIQHLQEIQNKSITTFFVNNRPFIALLTVKIT